MLKIFGTDGVRCKVNEEPMTPDTCLKIAKAAGYLLSNKVIKKNNQTIFFFDLAIYLNFLSMAISPEPRRKIANVITPHIKGYS